jgi:hypothetical protein
MKTPKALIVTVLLTGLLAAPLMRADDSKKEKTTYPLTTCVVSGEKLGGDMGDPYIFTYKDKNIKDDPGREVRLCCKSCLKDFNKEPAKYLKKIDEAEAKAKK